MQKETELGYLRGPYRELGLVAIHVQKKGKGKGWTAVGRVSDMQMTLRDQGQQELLSLKLRGAAQPSALYVPPFTKTSKETM